MFLRANLIILKHWVSRCWHSGHRIQPSIVEVVGSNSAFITGQKKRRNKRPKFFSWMIANSRIMILQAFDCKLFFFFEKRTIYGLFFFLCIVSIGTKNQNVQYYILWTFCCRNSFFQRFVLSYCIMYMYMFVVLNRIVSKFNCSLCFIKCEYYSIYILSRQRSDWLSAVLESARTALS